jgi:hypothetical protein
MKELLEIYNAEEISLETRIKIIQKMIEVLNYQVGGNIYDDIANELCNILQKRIITKNDLAF